MEYQEVNERIIDALATRGADRNEIDIICNDKYERARVLLALRDVGVDINTGTDRSWHIRPESAMCDFEYPHVRVRRYEISCTFAEPKDYWYNADQFIEALKTVFDKNPEQMNIPSIPDLI